jgi:hypothetical protein
MSIAHRATKIHSLGKLMLYGCPEVVAFFSHSCAIVFTPPLRRLRTVLFSSLSNGWEIMYLDRGYCSRQRRICKTKALEGNVFALPVSRAGDAASAAQGVLGRQPARLAATQRIWV